MLFSKLGSKKIQGLVTISVILASIFVAAMNVEPTVGGDGDWWSYSWQLRKSITINHTKVASDLIDFVVLIDVTDADLQAVAQADADDIAFADYSGNKLDHEIEFYDDLTGHLTVWVRLPSLSSTADTTIYMYYGNPTASSQENPGGVWGSDYAMVQHLEEASGIHYDSTSNDNDGIPMGAYLSQIDEAVDWIVRAQDVHDNGGVAHYYDISTSSWYPGDYDEVTGYIIPTMYNWADYTGNNSLRDRAEYMADWLVSELDAHTSPNGPWRNVFVPSQMMLGLIRAYTETDNATYLDRAKEVADWLVSVQEDDGCWTGSVSYNSIPHTYHARLDWPLLLLWDATGNSTYKQTAIKNLDWVVKQQLDNGWFHNCSLSASHEPHPGTHGFGYTIEGLFECGSLLNNDTYIDATRKTANAFLNLRDTDGSLTGCRYYSDWSLYDSDEMLTGSAQICITWLKLYEHTGNATWLAGAEEMNEYLGSKQGDSPDPGIDGGLAGSDPIDGSYMPNKILSWATKFLADSLYYQTKWKPQAGLCQNATGKVDGADDFDGLNSYIDVGSSNSIDNIRRVTISAWIRPDSWGEVQGDSAAGYVYYKGFTGGKAVYIYNNPEGLHFVHGFSGHYGWWYGGGFVFDGSWYFVTVTFDNTDDANDPSLYIDGVPVSITEGDTPSGGALSDGSYDGYVGTNLDGSRNFNGTVDEFRVLNVVRGADWILTEYNNQLDPGSFYVVGGEEVRVLPEAPWLTGEYPLDGAGDVELNPMLGVNVTDFQGDLMTVIFYVNVTGSWVELGRYVDVGNGTCTQVTSGMDGYSTMYFWRVCASDGTNWTNETYRFTTRPENYPPSVSNPSPQDGATGVGFNPTLSVDVNDLDEDSITVIFSTNSTGTWKIIGSQTGGDGRYNQSTDLMNDFGATYYWCASATDGKTWTNKTFAFTVWTEEDLYKQIGYYYCAGLPYTGESKDKDTFYMIWFAREDFHPWPPSGNIDLWYAEFNRQTGWVNGSELYMSWLCNWGAVNTRQSCAHFGYFGDEYHVWWGRETGDFYHLSATEWSDFHSMTGGWENWGNFGQTISAWGSAYAFNNSYGLTFYTIDYPDRGHTIIYWVWTEETGWSDVIPINSTSTGGHEHYPHDCSGAVLLPINRTTWYVYYKGGSTSNAVLYVVKSFDAGTTWGTPQVADIPEQINWRTHRPSFVRYGDNFYMIVNVGGSDIVCYNSTDGLHWGNKQIMQPGNWYVPHGVMLDQSHILWTASELGWYPDTARTGDEFGGVFQITEMIADPGRPSNPYPSNGALLPEGTERTTLEVEVHGDQTYDVAFYWANGTFIGEDKLLQEGETASVEVSALSNGTTYQWYTIARGTTWSYWGNEPAKTSDENRSETFKFTIGGEPVVNMNPDEATCRKHCETFTVEINVSNAIEVEDFAFELHYNSTLLDYVDLAWGPFLDGLKVLDTINETAGIIRGYINESNPANGSGRLLSITFHANKTMIWKDCPNWSNMLEGAIWFHWTELSYTSGIHLRYEEWVGGKREITVNQVNYAFLPLQGDLENDGDVDIYDLRTVGVFYNVKEGDPLWPEGSNYDLNCDGIIDIFDLIIVAVVFDTTYDC